eukprot:sb/3470072/
MFCPEQVSSPLLSGAGSYFRSYLAEPAIETVWGTFFPVYPLLSGPVLVTSLRVKSHHRYTLRIKLRHNLSQGETKSGSLRDFFLLHRRSSHKNIVVSSHKNIFVSSHKNTLSLLTGTRCFSSQEHTVSSHRNTLVLLTGTIVSSHRNTLVLLTGTQCLFSHSKTSPSPHDPEHPRVLSSESGTSLSPLLRVWNILSSGSGTPLLGIWNIFESS